MTVQGTASELTADQRRWLAERGFLQAYRFDLAQSAAALYPKSVTVAGTSLLSCPGWMPARPVPLDGIGLVWSPQRGPVAVSGTDAAAAGVHPLQADGQRFGSYAAAMAQLAAPAVFADRGTYQLQAGDLAGPRPVLRFGPGSYFDSIDTGEACAHEFAAAMMAGSGGRLSLPLRESIGDPCDPTRRPMNIAVSTLTLRHDRSSGQIDFPLHWRDPAKVGHAGGLYMVMPVGVFQACADGPQHRRNDFSLWRNMVREFAEELLGESEEHDDGPIDYPSWPFAAALTAAKDSGLARAHVLGMGADPLTLATDLLTVVTLDAAVYDELFDGLVAENSEGLLYRGEGTDQARCAFTAEAVEELTATQPLQAAGTALIRLAWRHRDTVLLPPRR